MRLDWPERHYHGANSGIGLSIATALASQGTTVYLACRSVERGQAATEEIIRYAGAEARNRVFCLELDTSDLPSVREFCARWESERRGTIDMLVLNAGIASPPKNGPTRIKEDLDIVYVTNFLGSFLLTSLLKSHLSTTARIVSTSSTGQYSGQLRSGTSGKSSSRLVTLVAAVQRWFQTTLGLTSSASPYALSKAQQVLFTQLLQTRLDAVPGNRRTVHSFTPGFTTSAIFGKFEVDWRAWISNPLFSILVTTEKFIAVDTDEGARTGVWLASRGLEIPGGGYWERMTRRTSLVDLLTRTMSRAEYQSFAEGHWKVWEGDSGAHWQI